MKNIAPDIMRQRLLVEAKYTIDVSEETVKDFLFALTKELKLRVYGDPIVHTADGHGKIENSGYDAFIPLIDSGIYIGVWTRQKFLSSVIYTCTSFSPDDAVEFIKKYFKTTEIVFKEF
ncbi:MAG: hypothetical protein COV29_02270 [Candidatus Yanofskybacteria bacterium CG10_big_fil_rev_8_21_14_0_10_36_16]|uniref:Uncharacterized protein n=1 Tax=Candidatus Yanofskybacteria bacterium CG10_big_fil_rev_8_21_14_0_10_36_16 TaxID=1975096 RepID=A0A2J0Q7L2_9BACT|nr:MAG: hypothetical protein COV29_02270 [Candidatus Yanofskybacteria bacterium CG10_big_fil_rev_8_21_14_0_10_36_16]